MDFQDYKKLSRLVCPHRSTITLRISTETVKPEPWSKNVSLPP